MTTATGFGSSVTISPDQAGTVTSTDVFVRLAAGLSAATYDGNITVSSTGVTDELIAVSGNAYGPPTNSLIITGVFDAKNGSSPKGVEMYVKNNIDDLSLYGVGSANNDNSIAGFSAYQNPVKGNNLTVTTSSRDLKTVNIYNVLGKKVFSQRFSSMNKTMNVSEIASGVYIMKVSEGNNIATKKLIIE